MNRIKLGLIIADKDEYRPLLEKLTSFGGVETSVCGRLAHKFLVVGQNSEVDVISVLCGIGKVNAAAAAAALCEKGVQIILNFGLSGGISGIARNEICIPDKFLEHDFDLTCLGYKPCEKPGQTSYIFSANKELSSLLGRVFEGAKHGLAATGDCFVQSEEKRLELKNNFNAVCCDMETAAIASVCAAYKVRFACVRQISDDAGDDAGTAYRQMNDLAEDVLANGVLAVISKL